MPPAAKPLKGSNEERGEGTGSGEGRDVAGRRALPRMPRRERAFGQIPSLRETAARSRKTSSDELGTMPGSGRKGRQRGRTRSAVRPEREAQPGTSARNRPDTRSEDGKRRPQPETCPAAARLPSQTIKPEVRTMPPRQKEGTEPRSPSEPQGGHYSDKGKDRVANLESTDTTRAN